jgi:hypothetical protein
MPEDLLKALAGRNGPEPGGCLKAKAHLTLPILQERGIFK